jgi:hypothetical protein
MSDIKAGSWSHTRGLFLPEAESSRVAEGL